MTPIEAQTLRRENEWLADFVDYLPVGCYSADTDGIIRSVNYRLAEWLGGSPSEIVGQGLEDVLGRIPDPEEERVELRLMGRGGVPLADGRIDIPRESFHNGQFE